MEVEGVDYGFEPSNKKRDSGFMRFQPRALKESAINDRLLVWILAILKKIYFAKSYLKRNLYFHIFIHFFRSFGS